MKGPMDRGRASSMARRMAAVCVGLSAGGCASTTQSVDAYYRQMAVNYKEAVDQAKLDEVTVARQAQVMGVTGDQTKKRKYEKMLEKIRKSEKDYAWEQKRFEQAAEWMETHFKIEKYEPVGASSSAILPGSPVVSDVASLPEPAPAGASEGAMGHDIPKTPAD